MKNLSFTTDIKPENNEKPEFSTEFVQGVLENMKLASSSNEFHFEDLESVNANIETIASAKKYNQIDNDFELIYKSTDFRNSIDSKSENQRNYVINDISPATIKYIKKQTSNIEDLHENSSGENSQTPKISKMSLSPGSLLEDPSFNDEHEKIIENELKTQEISEKNNENLEKEKKNKEIDQNEKNNKKDELIEKIEKHQELAQNLPKNDIISKEDNPDSAFFSRKSRVTEFGLKNILSVIEENSNEKNEESSMNTQQKSADHTLSSAETGQENKENFNLNISFEAPKEKLEENNTDISLFKKKKSVNFDSENSELVDSSAKRKKYKKTPILHKFKKMTYEEMENLPIHGDKKIQENMNFIEKKMKLSKSGNENNSKVMVVSPKRNLKTDCVQIIESSPLTLVQKNKLIEILSSNCKKGSNNMDLIKSMMSEKPAIDIMEILKMMFKEKIQLGQKISKQFSEKKKEILRMQAENEKLKKNLSEKREKAEKIRQNLIEISKKNEKIEKLKILNNNYSSANFMRVHDIRTNSMSPGFKLCFSVPGLESLFYTLEVNNRTIVNFSSQISQKDQETEKKSNFIENSKLIDIMILKRLKSETERLKNPLELVNKAIFFVNSLGFLMRIIDKIEKQYNFSKITINSDAFLVEMHLKFFNSFNKLIKFEINAFDWFEDIKMGFEGEILPEKMGNVLNTIYNSEVTKVGVHKFEKILEKIMNWKIFGKK